MEFKVDFTTYLGIYRTIMTEKLNVPTSEGRRTILSNHMPIMMSLSLGLVETLEDDESHYYIVNNGVLYFENNEAEIVADNVIDINEIEVERAKASLEKAKKNLEKAKRPNDIARAQEKYDVAKFIIDTYHEYIKQE